MGISVKDKILIENSRKEENGARKNLNDFPSKDWSRSGLDSLLRRTDATGSADRKVGIGRPRSARTSVSQHHKSWRAHLQSRRCSRHPQKSIENEQITRIVRRCVRRIGPTKERFGTEVVQRSHLLHQPRFLQGRWHRRNFGRDGPPHFLRPLGSKILQVQGSASCGAQPMRTRV